MPPKSAGATQPLSTSIPWRPFPGFDGLYYHVLDVDKKRDLVDMLMKFDSGSKCVPHRHVGPTRTLVIEGDHLIFDSVDPNKLVSTRSAGTFSTNNGDETHIEGGGDNGAVILLSMTAVNQEIYEVFDANMVLNRVIDTCDFERGLKKQNEENSVS